MTEREKNPKGITRGEFLKLAAVGFLGFTFGSSTVLVIFDLYGTKIFLNLAQEAGEDLRKKGTPTPSPEWEKSEEILRNSTVQLNISSGLTRLENGNIIYETMALGSAGLVSGNLLQRPDVAFAVTAKHVVLNQKNESRLGNREVVLANGIKKINAFIVDYGVAVSSQDDAAVIAFRTSGARADPGFFEGLIQKVDPKWDGSDENTLIASYSPSFSRGIDQAIPSITELEKTPPNPLYFADTNYKYYKGEGGHASGSSGGPVLDTEGRLVGILSQISISSFPDVSKQQYYIAVLSDFYSMAEEALVKLDSK